MNLNHLVALIAACALIAIGVCLGWLAWGRQSVAILEKQAAPVWHDDGSVTAIRAPNATPVIPAPSAPAGGVLIRTVEVTVRAKPEQTPADSAAVPPATDCPAVTVRLDLHQYEGGVRVSVQSDGEVLDAVDIPRSTIFVHDVKRNVIGLDVSGDRKTLKYGRALGAVDVGLQVSEEAGDLTHGGWVAFRF